MGKNIVLAIMKQRDEVFKNGHSCLMAEKCCDTITQSTCKTCPIDLCEQGYREYLGGPVKLKVEFDDYIHTKLKTKPQHDGFK